MVFIFSSGSLLSKLSRLSLIFLPCHFTEISECVHVGLGLKFLEGRFYHGF